MEKRNHDVYNHPQSENEVDRTEHTQNDKEDHQISSNPNPRANENIVQRNRTPNETDAARQVGSEITDGEDA